MRELPHRYEVSAAATPEGDIALVDPAGDVAIATAIPVDFDGPGGRWSPESLLVGAAVDCFALTFRGVARRFQLPWNALRCDAVGTLDRVDRLLQFTRVEIHATLDVPSGVDVDQARRLLERAEQTCLITNSLKATSTLEATIRVTTDMAA